MKRLQLLFFFYGFTHLLAAQVAAPNLICVRNDTLIWETPGNACGAFVSYQIFASASLGGPYTLLADITDPTQTSYFDNTATGAARYYYMQSNYNCSGQPVLQSDTLDNRIPEAGSISYVSVVGDDVEIAWNASPSPEVVAYVISKNTILGTTILDTVSVGTGSYLDTNAQADQGVITYFVIALDACGTQSLVPLPHMTLLPVATSGTNCEDHITLSWNAYQNWPGGVRTYEVWVSVNGQPPVLAGEAPGNQSNFIYEGANDGDTYCFFIRAFQEGTNVSANSSVTCVTAEVEQALRSLLMENVTFTAAGNLEWQWQWATNATLVAAEVQSAFTANGNFGEVANFPIPPTLNTSNSLLSTDMPMTAEYYRIRAMDVCDREVFSNAVRPPLLTGASSSQGVNQLTWTAYANDLATVTAYEVYRISNTGIETFLTMLPANTLQYTDAVDITNPDLDTASYYVVALAALNLPDGSTKNVQSRSNTTRLDQVPLIFVPNAFAPSGINRTFQPVLQFGEANNYLMVIYDRWGGKVFSTTDFSIGWNGEKDGRLLPQGVYNYYIRIGADEQSAVEKKGSVLLLR